jgi:hypothetical protein
MAAPIVALQAGLQQLMNFASAVDFPDVDDIALPSDAAAVAISNFGSRAATAQFLATLLPSNTLIAISTLTGPSLEELGTVNDVALFRLVQFSDETMDLRVIGVVRLVAP